MKSEKGRGKLMELRRVSVLALRTLKEKWYWALALLLLCVLLSFSLEIWAAIGVFILGIVAITSFAPESFFAMGIAVTVIMGVFLATRAAALALDTSKIAFALMGAGTLLGVWRLWTTAEAEEGRDGEEENN